MENGNETDIYLFTVHWLSEWNSGVWSHLWKIEEKTLEMIPKKIFFNLFKKADYVFQRLGFSLL